MFPAKVNTRRGMSIGIFRFGDFELDSRSGELRKRGRALRLQQQPAQVLAMLVAARGEMVTREELRDRIWGRETYVDFDRAINKAINHLRQLLGDDADRPRFIETLPRRGYRFVAGVAQSAARREIRDEARESYLKARYFWNRRTPDDLRRSIAHSRRAIANDPVSPTIAAFVSYVALEARRVEAAVAAARDALELDRNAPITHYVLGRAYAIAGDMTEAIATLRTAVRLAGWSPFIEACLGYAYARAGDRPRAEQILARLRTRALTAYVSPIDLAQVHLGLHDRDAAIALLEEAYRTRAVRTVIIGDPFFSELVSDARYRDLLASLRLPL